MEAPTSRCRSCATMATRYVSRTCPRSQLACLWASGCGAYLGLRRYSDAHTARRQCQAFGVFSLQQVQLPDTHTIQVMRVQPSYVKSQQCHAPKVGSGVDGELVLGAVSSFPPLQCHEHMGVGLRQVLHVLCTTLHTATCHVATQPHVTQPHSHIATYIAAMRTVNPRERRTAHGGCNYAYRFRQQGCQ